MPRNSAHSLLRWSCLTALLVAFILPAIAQQPKPGMPRSERHESRHEIDQLEDTWRSATLKRDATTLANLLSDDYIGITADGTLQSKDESLGNLRSGVTQFNRLDLSDRRVRFYAQTAVVTSRAEVAGTGPNGALAGSYRYTHVYVRDASGKWKIVSFEASRIREPGDKK
jgi:ketosteroid isomerase-like protein